MDYLLKSCSILSKLNRDLAEVEKIENKRG